jgi:hypothetical protein
VADAVTAAEAVAVGAAEADAVGGGAAEEAVSGGGALAEGCGAVADASGLSGTAPVVPPVVELPLPHATISEHAASEVSQSRRERT